MQSEFAKYFPKYCKKTVPGGLTDRSEAWKSWENKGGTGADSRPSGRIAEKKRTPAAASAYAGVLFAAT